MNIKTNTSLFASIASVTLLTVAACASSEAYPTDGPSNEALVEIGESTADPGFEDSVPHPTEHLDLNDLGLHAPGSHPRRRERSGRGILPKPVSRRLHVRTHERCDAAVAIQLVVRSRGGPHRMSFGARSL